MNKVLSDERSGAKFRVTENRCVLFDSFTYIYIYIHTYIYIYIYIHTYIHIYIYIYINLDYSLSLQYSVRCVHRAWYI